ncbi:TPA: hypothetical protein QCW92_004944 [Bacillus paranthracis]|nr:hypothetical protein [Bacillus paranthracis]MRC72436.1 hypothetical protein [Bacillus thuringiensis]OTX70077.1 hypothetical protein BK722_16875 [Bacillus thuringiensis serovar finitimus]TNP28305.1 hypothetical protein FH036_03890 [Bacillus sp. CD3-5]QCU13312.1 hypothetical protein BCPR1_14335 [Bacillus paranthracis]
MRLFTTKVVCTFILLLDSIFFFNSYSNESIAPFVRPHQGNASVYFIDPDGNSLELICHIIVPNALKHITNKLSFKDWEKLLADTFE